MYACMCMSLQICNILLEFSNMHPGNGKEGEEGWGAIQMQRTALHLLECFPLFGNRGATRSSSSSSSSSYSRQTSRESPADQKTKASQTPMDTTGRAQRTSRKILQEAYSHDTFRDLIVIQSQSEPGDARWSVVKQVAILKSQL